MVPLGMRYILRCEAGARRFKVGTVRSEGALVMAFSKNNAGNSYMIKQTAEELLV